MSTSELNRCGRQNNTLQRCLQPNSGDLWILLCCIQKGVKIVDRIKAANRLPWNRLITLDSPNKLMRVLKSKRRRQKRRSRGCAVRRFDQSSLAWRRRKSPGAKDCGQPPEAGRGKKQILPLEPPGRKSALVTPWFEPSETHIGLVREEIRVAISHSSDGNLLQKQ